jgi:F-type H+-transporting ATPase subunit b
MLHDPTFWVAVGFVIFLAAVGKKLWAALTGQLDARAARIRGQIEEAERLRAEAQALVAEYKAKHAKALQEAEAILARAREEARRIAAESTAATDAAMKRREQQTLDKIAQAEQAALREVRNQAVDIAIAAARRIVAEEMKGQRGTALVEAAIKELPGKLH